jgi:hypothetical protein
MLKILDLHGWSPRAKHHWAMALTFVGLATVPLVGYFALIPCAWGGWLLGHCATLLSPEVPQDER